MRIKSFIRNAFLGLSAMALVTSGVPTESFADGPRTVAKRSASDQRLGDENHPKILAQFGGEVANKGLRNYVNEIGRKLASHSEQPEGPWTFTVLDSPVVNAFALPGGYVYVTRGLVALANDEAELAGVIGHEIGHVTGAHSAGRQERSTIAQLGVLGATILGAVAGLDGNAVRAIGQIGNTIGQGYVASYSREQEYEADELGVRYIARAGYDPSAQSDFLNNLKQTTRLQTRLAGGSYDPNRVDFLSTHPATGERVRKAMRAARDEGINVREGAPRNQERHFREIEGMVYGDSAEQGFVRGRTFSHPKLRFTFTVPQNFKIQNSSSQVTAGGPNGSGIVFDGDKDPGGSIDQYITRVWAPGISKNARTGRLSGLRKFQIDGRPAASALLPVETRNGVRIARMTAIRMEGTIYRFLGIQPQGADQLGRKMDLAASSFRRLSKREANALKPHRIAIHKVRKGEDVRDLARRTPFDEARRARFRVLNGMEPGSEVKRGQRVKLVLE